jgi:hypothetical protein
MLLSVASKMNNWDTWRSMPRPSFSNFQPGPYAEAHPGFYELHKLNRGEKNHYAPADPTPKNIALYDDLEEPDYPEWA